MNELQSIWKQHETSPFPDQCRGQAIDGIDLVLLDTETAGCISTILGSSNRLDVTTRDILKKCQDNLVHVVKQLDGEALKHFCRLNEMAGLALKLKIR